MRNRCIFSKFNDPYLNLAIENDLLLNIGDDERILFLYVNDNSIVMGRFQNPWIECNLEFMKNNGIKLVRRQSGGGCVFHDSGNLNFSFIQAQREISKEQNNKVVLSALKSFDINAFATKRSDLKVEHEGYEFKISGSAFKQKRDRSFHHGTVLIDSNMNLLRGALKTPDYDITSKSIDSVRSKSLCLKSISESIAIEPLVQKLKEAFECTEIESVNESFINESILEEASRLSAWTWLIGETPYFEYGDDIIFKKGLVVESKNDDIKVGQRITDIDFKACSSFLASGQRPLYNDY